MCRTILGGVALVSLWCWTVLNSIAADSVTSTVVQSATQNEQRIKHALQSKVDSVDFQGQPLNEVLDYLADKFKIPIQIDVKALKDDAQIEPTTTLITVPIRDLSLRSALNLIISEYDLAYLIRDEVLLVTTKEKANSMLEIHLYDVHDLVLPQNDPSGTPAFDPLIEALRLTVNPTSWDKAGGSGSLAPFNSNGISALIVSQTYSGHEQIENLLAELRKLKPQRGISQ